MKVNLKKIGAIVAGATILASSVSFAGLMFGSTQLVDGNGAPVAKVVVGENAAASDGVAAALIASKLASAAFKTSTLTAAVSGAATCDSAGTGGSCTVSDEKVTLEVTVPGSVAAGTYTVNNLIGDYLNRDLLDRNVGSSQTSYDLAGYDTSDPSNPFKNGDGSGGNIGVSKTEMNRISGSMFSPFATVTLTDTSANRNYQEMQDMWIFGNNKYSDSKDQVIGKLNFISYTLKFKGTGDEFGIPVCTTPTNSTLYATCADDYETASHKLSVKFLGEDWIISEMSAPSVATGVNENILATGTSYVKLAKESVAGIINQGESLTAGDLKFQLDDLEAHGDTTSAIISVLDSNGNLKKKDKVSPGETKEFVIDGVSYRFHVYKVAPGYTFGAKWADVAVYQKELKLQHGQKLDPDYDNNKYWYVYLGWKNKGGTSTENQPDHLRTIVLYADDMSSITSNKNADMVKDDFVPIVMDPVKWKLSYKGLDIDNAQRDYLHFTVETSNLSITNTNGPVNSSGLKVGCTVTAPYVTVKSGRTGSVFEVTGLTSPSGGAITGTNFVVATAGAPCDASLGTFNAGSLFMKDTSDNYVVRNYTGESTIRYSTIGDGFNTWAEGGLIAYANRTDATNGTGNIYGTNQFNISAGVTSNLDWVFAIAENTGVGVSLGKPAYSFFGLDTDVTSPSNSDFNIDVTNNASAYIFKKDYMRYDPFGPVDTAAGTVEEGFVTERGSVFRSIEKSSVQFDMANQLAHAQWYLASVSSNVTPGTSQLTLKEGETGTVSGVTIKAKSIDETAVCTGGTGGAPACTPNMTAVSGVIIQDGQQLQSVTASTPYDFSKYTPLVVLDKDAVGVSTVISVGGDVVNTVTKSILAGTAVDWDAQPKMVKEVVKGSKIVVAGKNAQDTTDAAADFISQLVAQ